jgi:hypothetical protein
MRDTDLVKALREHAEWQRGNEWETPITLGDDLVEAAARIANQNTHILALQKEIEGLRSQNEQLREAAALVTKESAELLERRWIPVEERLPATESWGASKVVLGIVQNESGYPPPNPCFCVYLGNQQWTIRGRMATITHWMPLPELPEEEK